ncbi:MAG: hypothetical protein JXQ91_00320 [Vannielia sp.]|uniref:hypothetical protein n=1 Tax=Rhodobacterales TaxID=204455 RepID=UPI002094FE17|nr:hypothetical protein [Oceanicola sp. 502str15]MCO6382630.1 hypothetical protein [Oceanicola sp. 502str15]
MTVKFVMPLGAVAAMSMALVAPASAQIAKFHVMAPAIPGLVQLDRISSADEAQSDFVGSTASMDEGKSASQQQMRDSEDVVAGRNEGISPNEGGDDSVLDTLFGGVYQKPPARPEGPQMAAIDAEPAAIASRPETGRQVIVRTRTKSPRGGSKIKTGSLWSVGEFR